MVRWNSCVRKRCSDESKRDGWLLELIGFVQNLQAQLGFTEDAAVKPVLGFVRRDRRSHISSSSQRGSRRFCCVLLSLTAAVAP